MIDDVLEALRAQAVMTAQSKWIPPHDHQSMGHRLAVRSWRNCGMSIERH